MLAYGTTNYKIHVTKYTIISSRWTKTKKKHSKMQRIHVELISAYTRMES